jgi:hypothetical protein
MMRDHMSTALLMTTRMRSVVIAGNVICVHTCRFPVMLPPGTVAHAVPVQYWTSKSVIPYKVNIVSSVGSTGVVYASCSVNTSISPMVCGPLKVTCTQSGNLLFVTSFQYPPAPALKPSRSPSFTPLTG